MLAVFIIMEYRFYPQAIISVLISPPFTAAHFPIPGRINRVGDKMGLPNGWLNTDSTGTRSYTLRLIAHAVYYRTSSNILTVRAERLIAMKLI